MNLGIKLLSQLKFISPTFVQYHLLEELDVKKDSKLRFVCPENAPLFCTDMCPPPPPRTRKLKSRSGGSELWS